MPVLASGGLSVGVEITGDGHDSVAEIFSLATRLENAGVHYWVIGADRGEPSGASRASSDPSIVATVAARHSTSLGLVVAAAAHRDHPYNLARRLLSVDHAARGRVGWLALDADHRIGLDAGYDTWTSAVLDPAHTAEAVAAVRTLWRTWPRESVHGNRDTGVFADTSQIRRADVDGVYSIAGPLNLPGSIQGDLPVWQHDGPTVRDADVVIVEEAEPVPGRPTVVRLRSLHELGATLQRLSRTAGAAGVLLRVTADALEPALDEVSAARQRGLLTAPDGATLRERLHLPPPELPDLITHLPAFAGAPQPGGRL
ncbi:luciferase [Mycobacterium sp. NPDC050041]|uniref:luciferase n=1 Tax=Mycobacterium sp. NPDC050041 TaxID=3364293 RepID=UPI003C2F76C9